MYLCNRYAAFSYPVRYLLMRKVMLLNKKINRGGNLHGVKILTLYILYERHLHELAFVKFPYDRGNRLHTRHPCGAVPPFAGHDDISVAFSPHYYRLHDAMQFY